MNDALNNMRRMKKGSKSQKESKNEKERMKEVVETKLISCRIKNELLIHTNLCYFKCLSYTLRLGKNQIFKHKQ